MAKSAKEKAIEREYKRISALYVKMPANKRQLAEGLIQNASFMSATLDELQAIINAEGAVIVNTSGNGFQIRQENPAQKSYNTTIKNYTATIKTLDGMLPPEETESKLTEFFAGAL